MIDAPSGGAPEQAPRWDLVDTESCGGGIRVLAPFDIPFLRNPEIGKKLQFWARPMVNRLVPKII